MSGILYISREDCLVLYEFLERKNIYEYLLKIIESLGQFTIYGFKMYILTHLNRIGKSEIFRILVFKTIRNSTSQYKRKKPFPNI